MSLTLTLSVLSVSSATTAKPAAAAEGPGRTDKEFVTGSVEAFSYGAKLFTKNFKSVYPSLAKGLSSAAYGLGFLGAIVGPLLSYFLGGEEGPTTQDVLDKLDEMSKQLDAIQAQLSGIQTQLDQLKQQLTTSTCSVLQSNLNTQVVAIEAAQSKFGDVLRANSYLAKAARPGSGININEAAATVQGQFTEFANQVLGNSSTTTAGLSLDVLAIHRALMEPQSGSGVGIIDQCAQSAIGNFRTLSSQPGRAHLAFVNDTAYYDEITNLVRYYQALETEGLSLIQEAGYFHATQDLIAARTSIGAEQGAATCVTAEGASGNPAAAVTCDSVAGFTETVYNDLVAEWALAGRPYSDQDTVLEVPSTASGRGDNIPAVLWARDPAAVKSMDTGTWSDTTRTTTYDGLSGWRPATLADWQALLASGQSTYHDCNLGSYVAYSNVFCFMNTSKQFVLHPDTYYWMPGQSSASVVLPTKTPDGQQMTVKGYGGHRYDYRYSGPALTMRCFVAVLPNQAESPVACGQDWINRKATGAYVAHDENTSNPIYTIDWAFRPGSFPRSESLKLEYFYHAPYTNAVGEYAYADGAYPARINMPATGSYPAFFNPVTFSHVTRWDDCYARTVTCPGATEQVTATPPETTLSLWPVLTVPTTPECVTTSGVPKLCTANTTAAPHQADRFNAWVADNIPDPNAPSPVPKAQPALKVSGTTASCVSAGWEPPPGLDWPWGAVTEQPTTWSASESSGGTTTKTVTTDGTSLDLAAFAKQTGFSANDPYRLTCVLNVRWKLLAQAASVTSPSVDITPASSSFVVTRLMDAPTNVSATLDKDKRKSATVHWTVPDAHGATIVSFTISPYVDGVAERPLLPTAVNGSNVRDTAGSTDSVEVPELTEGRAYRFSITANAYAVGTSHLVPGLSSALTATLTPTALAPLTPGTTTTTTTSTTSTTSTTTTTTTTTTSTTTTVPTGPFSQSITAEGATRALVTFTPKSAMSFVDVHYIDPRIKQQDFRMNRNGQAWTFEINQLQPADKVEYWFSYQLNQAGAPIDTSDHFHYTQP